MRKNRIESAWPHYRMLLARASMGLGALLLSSTSRAQQSTATQAHALATSLALTGVTVIDVTDGRPLPNQTVVVTGNRIQAIGPVRQVRVPRGAQVVDARGKYLIPGLWDMHAHTEFPTIDDVAFQDSLYRTFYPIYIANGVTGLREMAQRFPNGADSFRVWQRQVIAGARVGPRAVGPSADLSYGIEIGTPDAARRIIDSLKTAGDAFVKYHDSFGTPDLFFAAAREAQRVGLPFVGHVPRAVTNVEAADSGMRSVEHVQENHQCWPPDPTAAWDSVAAEQRCSPVAKAYIRNGTWMVPTLVVYYYLFYQDREIQDEDLAQRVTFRKFLNAQRFMRMMHRLGIRKFLTGTDCAAETLQTWGLDPVCHRGFSVLEELAFLVESGLTPLEALQAGTINPAKFFDATDSLGTVAADKLADLVLLDGDPLADIHNVMKIRAVVANGRYFDRTALDALDPEGAKLARSYAEQQPSSAKAASTTP